MPWLILVPPLVIGANRNRQAAAVLIPIGVVAALFFPVRFAMQEFLGGGWGWDIPGRLALALGALWLLAHKLSGRSRAAAFFQALGIMLLAGVAAAACGGMGVLAFGAVGLHLLFSALLLVAMSLAGTACRRRYTARRFSVWVVVSCVAVCLAAALPVAALIVISAMGADAGMVLMILPGFLGSALMLGLLLACLLLCFLVLAYRNGFYRQRLHRVLRLPGMDAGAGEPGGERPPAIPTAGSEGGSS